MNNFEEKQENEKKELIHKELPSLLHRILSIRLMQIIISGNFYKNYAI